MSLIEVSDGANRSVLVKVPAKDLELVNEVRVVAWLQAYPQHL
jgi:hypothetical protein